MPILDPARSILLVIDFQGKLVQQVHRSAMVLETTRRLMKLAELCSVPVVLTEQYPKGLGPTEAGLKAQFDALSVPTFLLEKTAFSCCGDPARRLGNEYLFQMQAQRNIEVLNNYKVKKIVTGCAHCFNSMAIDEYFDSAFGPLPYRSIRFRHETVPWTYRKGEAATVNYTDAGPLTRETDWSRLPGHAGPPGAPHSLHSFSQFQSPYATLFGNGNPS